VFMARGELVHRQHDALNLGVVAGPTLITRDGVQLDGLRLLRSRRARANALLRWATAQLRSLNSGGQD